MAFLAQECGNGSFWSVPLNMVADGNEYFLGNIERAVLMGSTVNFRNPKRGEHSATPLLAAREEISAPLEGKVFLYSRSKKTVCGAFRLALDFKAAAEPSPMGQWVSKKYGAQLSLTQLYRLKAIMAALRHPKYNSMKSPCMCDNCKSDIEHFIQNRFLH